MAIESQVPSSRPSPWRRAFSTLVVLVLVWMIGRPLYLNIRLTAYLSSQTITDIELTPNGDYSLVRLQSDDQFDAFVKWLSSTKEDSSLRSAPPPMVFAGTIRFADGHDEQFLCSAILPTLREYPELDNMEKSDRHLLEVRGDVRIYFRGQIRSGDRDPLAELISAAADGSH